MKKEMSNVVLSVLMLACTAVFADYTMPHEIDTITADVWQMEEFVLSGDGSANLLVGDADDPNNNFIMYAGSVPSKSVGQIVAGPTVDFSNAVLFAENAGQLETAVPNVTARTSTSFLASHGSYAKIQMWFRPNRLGQHQVLAHAKNVTWAISIQGNNLVVTLWFADGTNSGAKTISDISSHIGEWLYTEIMFSNKDAGKLEASVKNMDGSFNQSISFDFPGKTFKAGQWLVIGGEEGRRGFYGAIDSFKLSYPPDYLAADISKNGYVDITDFSLLAADWLKCTDIDNPDCF